MSKSQKPLINLLKGWPSPSLAPINAIRVATQKALADPDVFVPGLNYGPDIGYGPLRENIARWLSSFYQPTEAIGSQRICISGGASQNLARVLQGFTDPTYTRNIWMIAPTYFLACRIFEDAGFFGKLRAVPEDDEGVDIKFLKLAIMKSEDEAIAAGNDHPIIKVPREKGKLYKHIIYAVPTFANPSAKIMSLARREDLVRIAREFDALVITDDVYDFLQWPARDAQKMNLEKSVQPRIVDVDRGLEGGTDRDGADGFGNAFSNGSFSKIVAPGVRCGWVEGTEQFAFALSQVGSTKSGGSPSQLVSIFMAELLESGDLQRHITDLLQPSYASRYRRMLAAIEKHLFPLGVSIPPRPQPEIAGGYFIWLDLPPSIKAKDVARRALEEENVTLCHGDLFEVYGDEDSARFSHSIRLCFALEDEDKFLEGISRIATVVECLLQQEIDQASGRTAPNHAPVGAY